MGLECKYVNVAGTGYEGIMLFLAEILCCAGKKVLISDCTVEHSMEGYFPCVKGLDPENAGCAVSRVHPFAVDVSSGIETDGFKDKSKMAAFAAAVKRGENK